MGDPNKAETANCLDDVLESNVETIRTVESALKAERDTSTVISDAIAAFCGSILFVWVHVAIFAAWLLINGTDLFPRSIRFDPAPFPMLTLSVSLEAIFLSTFILISQNRQQAVADHRNHLDLQINLLAEQENSEMMRLLRAMSEKMGIEANGGKLDVLQEETDALNLAKKLKEATIEGGG